MVTPITVPVIQKYLESDRRFRERRHPQWTMSYTVLDQCAAFMKSVYSSAVDEAIAAEKAKIAERKGQHLFLRADKVAKR
jgi:hypothetical protein